MSMKYLDSIEQNEDLRVTQAKLIQDSRYRRNLMSLENKANKALKALRSSHKELYRIIRLYSAKFV